MNRASRVFLLLTILCTLHPSHSFCPSTRHVFLKPPPTGLAAGGFGGGGSNAGVSVGGNRDSNNKKKSSAKESKLKPKQQWDRYLDLKSSEKIRVGVKVKNEWLQVGSVKSQSDVSNEVAVARQRALIAEHAKRLYPLKVSPKDTVEWGYRRQQQGEGEDDTDDWIVVDKSVLNGLSDDDIEKRIGFEGSPDPSTGYYCKYNEGRLVKSDKDVPAVKPRKRV